MKDITEVAIEEQEEATEAAKEAEPEEAAVESTEADAEATTTEMKIDHVLHTKRESPEKAKKKTRKVATMKEDNTTEESTIKTLTTINTSTHPGPELSVLKSLWKQ